MSYVIRFLASYRLTFLLLIIISALSIYASLIPSEASASVVSSGWFNSVFAALFVNIFSGALLHIRNEWRKPALLLTKAGVLLVLVGAFMGKNWGSRLTVKLSQGRLADAFQDPSGKTASAGFGIRLDKFDIERYPGKMEIGILPHGSGSASYFPVSLGQWAGPAELKIKPLAYLPNLKIGAGGAVYNAGETPDNPALEVEVRHGGESGTGWLFARFPEFQSPGLEDAFRYGRIFFRDDGGRGIKSYRSCVTFFRNGREAGSAVVEVNHPAKFGGFRVYQSSYDASEQIWSGLQLVRDPGLLFVYLGYCCLAVGITLWIGVETV